MENQEVVLCGASSYTKKFYLNPAFSKLPKEIQEDLKVRCVVYCAEASGSIEMVFNEDKELEILTDHKDEDALFDEISSGLKVIQMQRECREMFHSLELYYRVVVLGEEITEDMM